MLSFLDALCRSLTEHDRRAIRRHLRHPLARALPPAVRSEALAIARAGEAAALPPTRAFRFYYQTLQLLASPEREAGHAPAGPAPSVERRRDSVSAGN